MKTKNICRILGLLVFVAAFLPINFAQAAPTPQSDLPPIDMFQLPWEQGVAWVTFDGLDNGAKRGDMSNHNYLNGGAVDFGPSPSIKAGDDTSNHWVTATAAGTVIELGVCHLKIDHGNGWVTEYQFLANFQVSLGEAVYRNQRLGIIADGVRDPFCPPARYPDIPHVHFSLRPTTVDAAFAGWMVNYDPINNITTLNKEGVLRHPYDGLPVMNIPYLQIAERGVLDWNLVSRGSLDAYRYERWTVNLTEPRSFTVTTTAVTPGLEPLIVLLDENGVEIAQGLGIFSSTQPAGTYFVEIRPQSGQGFYDIILQGDDTLLDPYIETIAPLATNAGGSATVEAYLGNIPTDGYTSVEVTCPYDANLVSINNISATDLFGSDPATAITGPSNGSFIFSIAGSHGQKALADGTAFTFSVNGLTVGDTDLRCAARISTGDGQLTDILAIGTSISVLPAPILATTALIVDDGLTTAVLDGQVLATKPVSISVYDGSNNLLNTIAANLDGTFSLGLPAGTLTVFADADGFLPARGPATLVDAETTTMPTVALRAGDIDGNFVIDQFDAMSIGMNYNLAMPASADLNADGVINVLDLEALAANYRASGVQDWQ